MVFAKDKKEDKKEEIKPAVELTIVEKTAIEGINSQVNSLNQKAAALVVALEAAHPGYTVDFRTVSMVLKPETKPQPTVPLKGDNDAKSSH